VRLLFWLFFSFDLFLSSLTNRCSLRTRISSHRGKNDAETVQFSLLLRDPGDFQRAGDLADFANLSPNQGRQAIEVFCGDIFHNASRFDQTVAPKGLMNLEWVGRISAASAHLGVVVCQTLDKGIH